MEQLLNESMNDSESEHVEPMLNDEDANLEEDVPVLRNRATGLVVDPSCANDTNEHSENHIKCAHDALHKLEGRSGELRPLGLTEDACKLLCAPENAQSKAVCNRHINDHNACVESDKNRTCDKNNIVNYFTDCYVAGNRKAGTFWCVRSCIKSCSLTSTKIDISDHELLRILVVSTTNKCTSEKAGMFDSDEFQSAMEETYDEEDPKELIDEVASLLSCYDMRRRLEASQIESQDVVVDNAEDTGACFPHPTKRHAEGFSHKTPGSTKSTFMKHFLN